MSDSVKIVHSDSGEVTSLTKKSLVKRDVRSFGCSEQQSVWVGPDQVLSDVLGQTHNIILAVNQEQRSFYLRNIGLMVIIVISQFSNLWY